MVWWYDFSSDGIPSAGRSGPSYLLGAGMARSGYYQVLVATSRRALTRRVSRLDDCSVSVCTRFVAGQPHRAKGSTGVELRSWDNDKDWLTTMGRD